MNAKQDNKSHYAWKILAVCCMIQGGVVGTIQNSCGVFYQPVCQDLVFDLSAFTLYTSLRGLAGCLTIPVAVRLLQRLELRVLLSGAVLVFSLANFLMGTFSQIWQWYVAAIVQGIASSFLAFVTTPLLLGRWFYKKLGLAIGLSSAFSGMFGIVANPFGSWVIEIWGWRSAYFILSVVCFALVFPFTALVVRRSPQEVGLERFGEGEGLEKQLPHSAQGTEISRVHPLVCFGLIIFLQMVSMVTMGFIQLLPAFGTSQGFTGVMAASLSSLAMAGNTTGKFILGAESDRFGIRPVSFISFSLPLVGFALLLIGDDASYPAAFLVGTTMPAAMVVMPILIQNVYGVLRYERAYTIANVLGNLVGAVSTPFFSLLFERHGNFRGAIACSLLLLCGALVVLHLAFPSREAKKGTTGGREGHFSDRRKHKYYLLERLRK